MNKYFENISTLEELRKLYKELLKLHHPDNGGNVSEMQEINSEYDRIFKKEHEASLRTDVEKFWKAEHARRINEGMNMRDVG